VNTFSKASQTNESQGIGVTLHEDDQLI